MKLLKEYYIRILFILLGLFIIVDYLGLYQLNKIKIDDISIRKPLWYKYSSASSMDSSTSFNIFKNIMGLNTKLTLESNHLLYLEFKQIFFDKSSKVVIQKLSENDIMFLKNISINKCSHQNLLENNSEYKFDDIIYKSRYRIYIVSNNKKDAIYFYDEICDK